jgi:uncharacterized protein YidB (DUF937 family)
MEAVAVGMLDFLKSGSRKAAAAGGAVNSTTGAPGGGAVAASSAEEGAISSLLDKFGTGGLGDTVTSWVGKGSNLPVSADQITSVLGSEEVAAIAGKLGISKEAAAAKIADVLPGIIDKVTPDGVVPVPEALADKLTGMLT